MTAGQMQVDSRAMWPTVSQGILLVCAKNVPLTEEDKEHITALCVTMWVNAVKCKQEEVYLMYTDEEESDEEMSEMW